MNKIRLVLLAFLLFSMGLFAQQKKYVSYKIKQGETMKSVAKDYNLSTKDLLRLNPGIKRKPRANTLIIVPNKDYGKVPELIQYNRTHIVKPKETIFGISRTFGVTMEALTQMNPFVKGGLEIGMRLKIPEPTITQAKDSLDYILHSVVKDDTKYNLSKRYEISEAHLETLNPMLSEGLKLGMLLKIKAKPEEGEEIAVSQDLLLEQFDLDREVSVAIMLPYQSNKYVDSTRIEIFKRENALLNYATEFHLGAMMAIDSLRQQGLYINVDYYDTENSKFKMQYLLNSANFSRTDLVIGPLFFDNAAMLSRRISSPVMIPFYSKKQEEHSSSVIGSSTNSAIKEEAVLNYMEANYGGEQILVVNDSAPENQSKLWRIVNKIKRFDSIQGVEVIKSSDGFIDGDLFKSKIDTLGSNWVLLISDENITTAATINNLKSYAEWVDIDFFSTNKGRNFEAIDNVFLGKMNFIFPTSEYFNYNTPSMVNFYSAYRRKNYADPTQFSIRGFDVTYDAIVRLNSYGSLASGLKQGVSIRLNGIFDYQRNRNGSYNNEGLFLIQYTPEIEPKILEIIKED